MPAIAPWVSETAACDKLAEALAADPCRWISVELRPLERESESFDQFAQALERAGYVVQPFFCFGNWYARTEGRDYRGYFESLPSQLKNTVTRKRKKLANSGRSRTLMVTDNSNLEEAIAAYDRVYSSSWKTPEPYPQFLPEWARACARQGWLRMGVVYIDETPVAAQLWVVAERKATIFKLAHDEKFSDFSAGSILTAQLLEHVIDVDRVEEIDFGSGDDPYKKSWLPERRERWGLLAFNPRTVRGVLGIARHVWAPRLRTMVRGNKEQQRVANW